MVDRPSFNSSESDDSYNPSKEFQWTKEAKTLSNVTLRILETVPIIAETSAYAEQENAALRNRM